MFWTGLATGIFLGAILGFSLCAILVISIQADEQAKNIGIEKIVKNQQDMPQDFSNLVDKHFYELF